MNSNPNIKLPNLIEYKEKYLSEGLELPLKKVPYSSSSGLLNNLPAKPIDKHGWPWDVESSKFQEIMPDGSKWPLLSIITPSFNQGAYIEETIRSVLLQNYPNLEYIIIDGGSTDNTYEILQKYDKWISFWQYKKDRGQGNAINLGFSIASGDYYAFMNSDDYYLPDCFGKVVDYFQKYKTRIIYGDSLTLNELKKNISYRLSFYVLDRYLSFGGILPSHSTFWDKKIHQPIWEKLYCSIDYELWHRLIPGNSKKHINTALSVCRVQNDAKSVHHKYKELWSKDLDLIYSVYKNNVIKNFKKREFRIVQGIYRLFNNKMNDKEINKYLPCNLK